MPGFACFNAQPTNHYTALGTGGFFSALPIRFLSLPADASAAERIRQATLLTRPDEAFAADFALAGHPHLRPLRRGARLELYVTDRATMDRRSSADGVQSSYCGDIHHGAIAVASAVGGTYAAYVVAHELFHALQSGAAHETIRAGWWTEATANFAGQSVLGAHSDETYRDLAFLEHPELPLDHVSALETQHQYGAARFVQWLHSKMPEGAFWRMLFDTFSRLGVRTNATQTHVLRGAERRVGRTLAADLGRFWADHLHDTADSGPAARIQNIHARSGVNRTHRSMRRLSAQLFHLGVVPGIQRVRVAITPGEPQHELWVDDGHLVDHHGGYSREFCVGGSAPGVARFPGELGIAYTNTGDKAGSLTITSTTFDAGPCRPDSCPAHASDGLARTSTASCPAPPPPRGCTAKDGYYDTSGSTLTTDPDRVFFDVFCVQGRGTELNGFGGAIECPVGTGASIDLGPSGGAHHVGKYLSSAGAITFSYTYLNASIRVTMSANGAVGSGTVTAQTPSCSRTYQFGAPWREP